LFTMMLMVRRAILRISCSVGGLGGMSSRYMEEMGSHWPFLSLDSTGLTPSWVQSKNTRLFVVSSRSRYVLGTVQSRHHPDTSTQ
jgi:hypothetical protein